MQFCIACTSAQSPKWTIHRIIFCTCKINALQLIHFGQTVLLANFSMPEVDGKPTPPPPPSVSQFPFPCTCLRKSDPGFTIHATRQFPGSGRKETCDIFWKALCSFWVQSTNSHKTLTTNWWITDVSDPVMPSLNWRPWPRETIEMPKEEAHIFQRCQHAVAQHFELPNEHR